MKTEVVVGSGSKERIVLSRQPPPPPSPRERLFCLQSRRIPIQSSDGVEHELNLIRNELHDGACQHIAAALALLEAFRNRNGGSDMGDSSEFNTALVFLSRASVELRRLVHGLPAIHLHDDGVVQSVEHLIAENRSSSGPTIEFRRDGNFDCLPPHWHATILRIVQESLGNACRHSHGDRILVTLTQDQDRIGIQVQDWGIGFELDEVEHRCHGLKSIRCRAQSLGGTAIVDACRGKGTRITVQLPLP
jgi:signal transduction histidine kinase